MNRLASKPVHGGLQNVPIQPERHSSWDSAQHCESMRKVYTYEQCWPKSLAPTRNFPASYDPNWNIKNLTGHFPTSNNVNRNMLNFLFLHIPNQKKKRRIPNQINQLEQLHQSL